MKRTALKVIAFSILFFVTSLSINYAFAQTVKTHVNADSVTVGDLFQYSLTLQLDEEFDRIVFPDTNQFPPSVELSERQQFKINQFSDSLIYTFQFFGSADIFIPELPVKLYSGQDSTIIYSDPITIYFKSIVEEGDSSIKPLKPIFDFPRSWWPLILVAILLAAFLIWWFYFRKEPESAENKPQPQIEPFYDPLKDLEKALVSIKKDLKVEQTKEFKLFYSALSYAIRRYYEKLYKIPALESTTRELMRHLDIYGADKEMIEATRKILLQADLVKFAKHIPSLDDANKTYGFALRFLEQAKTVDSARVSQLKAQYDAQFMNNEKEEEDA